MVNAGYQYLWELQDCVVLTHAEHEPLPLLSNSNLLPLTDGKRT